MAGSCPTCLRRPRCSLTRSARFGLVTTPRACVSPRGRLAPGGSGSVSIWAGRSTSCTRWPREARERVRHPMPQDRRRRPCDDGVKPLESRPTMMRVPRMMGLPPQRIQFQRHPCAPWPPTCRYPGTGRTQPRSTRAPARASTTPAGPASASGFPLNGAPWVVTTPACSGQDGLTTMEQEELRRLRRENRDDTTGTFGTRHGQQVRQRSAAAIAR